MVKCDQQIPAPGLCLFSSQDACKQAALQVPQLAVPGYIFLTQQVLS